ncbi:zinc finger BED domain-containing protein RICESLEEPER 4-like [Rosa chinensis]|uniref:zinc finger BED domain-containing protein RICESLEEPER 4-like n=1 Tax=Rosa chinensis TaxID=74649 RepID=UPI001AD8F378|nr:zinc finger BED domain-containing protein RICESLEEPER 4-like [Rosa chinensis]
MDSSTGTTPQTQSESQSQSHSEPNSNSDSSDSNPDTKIAKNVVIATTDQPSSARTPSTMTSSRPPRPKKRVRQSTSTGLRERSMVWEHYDKVDKPLYEIKDGKKVQVGTTMRAKCRYCSTDLTCNPYDNGTSSLKRHIEVVCKKYPGRIDLEEFQQVFVASGNLNEPSLTMRAFIQDACIRACVEMIVIDELPFSHPEKEGFQRFFSLAPAATNELGASRFSKPRSLTTDPTLEEPLSAITGAQSTGFQRSPISSSKQAKPPSKMESVPQKPPTLKTPKSGAAPKRHTRRRYRVKELRLVESAFLEFWERRAAGPVKSMLRNGRLLEKCRLEWEVERVLTVSVDNASANKVAVDYIRNKMLAWKKPPVLGGKWLHVRCLAHILNLIVKSRLRMMDKYVVAIRNAVRYVRSSSTRLDVFKQCVAIEQLDCKKVCILDVPTRWNSTFLMLDVALELRKAFDHMAEDEDLKYQYRSYFDEDEVEDDDWLEVAETEAATRPKKNIKRVGPPVGTDWERAIVFVNFLKVFYDVTMRISATNSPTGQKAFHDIVTIEAEINDLFDRPEMCIGSNTEKILLDMAVKMRSKFKKYFASLDDMNHLLLVALGLDPRYKLRNFERVCRIWLKLDSASIKGRSAELKELLVNLTDLYSSALGTKKSKPSGNEAKKHAASGTGSSSTKSSRTQISGKMAAMQADWKQELEDSYHTVISHEVDRYLLDPIEDPPEHEDWKLLVWWKLNGAK